MGQFTAAIPPRPFLDANGDISQEWRLLLMNLLARTGGSSGTDIASALSAASSVLAYAQSIDAELAFADIADPAPNMASAFALGLAAEPDIQPIPDTSAFALLMADDAPPAGDNPYLAALLVADIS